MPKKVHTLLILLDLGPDDEPPLAFDKVRYRGEPVAAVIAETESAAAAAAAKVRVDYEPLPSVFDVEEALEPGAPLINEYHGRNWYDYNGHDFQKIRFGDVERAFREADHVIEERYQMTPIEHAPTETGGCIAAPDTADRYICYTNTQALFFSLETAAQILKVPSNRLTSWAAPSAAASAARWTASTSRLRSSGRCSPSARCAAPTAAPRRCRCRARAARSGSTSRTG